MAHNSCTKLLDGTFFENGNNGYINFTTVLKTQQASPGNEFVDINHHCLPCEVKTQRFCTYDIVTCIETTGQ